MTVQVIGCFAKRRPEAVSRYWSGGGEATISYSSRIRGPVGVPEILRGRRGVEEPG